MKYFQGVSTSLLGVAAVLAIVQPANAQLSGQQIGVIARGITVLLEMPGSNGSGVLIRRDGDIYTVLTAYHVVKSTNPSEEAYVTTFYKNKQKHRLDSSSIRQLGKLDLAIVQFRSTNDYQVAKIGDSRNLQFGTDVYVSGFPLPTSTFPKSSLAFLIGQVVSILDEPNSDGYQIAYDNKTLTGVSGGAVLNANGELVAIHGLTEGEVVMNNVAKTSGRNLGVPSALFISLIENISTLPVVTSPPISLPPQARNGLSLEDYFARAANKQNQSDFRGAIKDYSELIQIIDQTKIAIISRARNRDVNKISKNISGIDLDLIEDAVILIQLSEYIPVIYNNRGLAKDELGYKQGAIADYTQAIQINPQFANAYYNRGFAYKVLGDRQEALESFRQAAQLYQQQGKSSDYQDAQNQIRKLGE